MPLFAAKKKAVVGSVRESRGDAKAAAKKIASARMSRKKSGSRVSRGFAAKRSAGGY